MAPAVAISILSMYSFYSHHLLWYFGRHRFMNPPPSQLNDILIALYNAGLTPATFFALLLNSSSTLDEGIGIGFVNELVHILDAAYERFSPILYPWASNIVFTQCEKEISILSNEHHIGAEKLTYGKLKSIQLGALAISYETKAPSVWNLLGTLLDVNSRARHVRSHRADARRMDGSDAEPDNAGIRREQILAVVCLQCTFPLLLRLWNTSVKRSVLVSCSIPRTD
jgi:hypothetical protein